MPSPPGKPAEITLQAWTETHPLQFKEERVPTPPHFKIVWELMSSDKILSLLPLYSE